MTPSRKLQEAPKDDPEYDPSKDGYLSYYAAIEAKRARGDKHWPGYARIELPFPSRDLHPNARVHWGAKAKATKKARATAGWAAKEAKLKPINAASLIVTAIFIPPNGRAHDVDNMLASCKAYFDGIADVICVDDSKWDIKVQKKPPKAPGSVIIQIEVPKQPSDHDYENAPWQREFE